MQSTLSLFRHLYNHLPPLFPADVAEKMKHVLEHLESDPSVTAEDVEHSMIVFGYEVWPWNQAFKDFLLLAEGEVGEHFLLPKLSPEVAARYQAFKEYGGTLRDLHSGRPADFFTLEERGELCLALFEMQQDLKAYVARELSGLSRQKYLRKVEEFGAALDNIKIKLEEMRALADKEQDHPNLAAEIRARVAAFEQGLCALGPELDYRAACESVEFFHGRKQDLNRMRGVHLPVEVEFYN